MDWDWRSDKALRYPFGGIKDENVLIEGEHFDGIDPQRVDIVA